MHLSLFLLSCVVLGIVAKAIIKIAKLTPLLANFGYLCAAPPAGGARFLQRGAKYLPIFF